MAQRERLELRLERLDGARPHHDPGEFLEFVDIDDDRQLERVLAQYFVPLACAAEGKPVADRLSQMPWLSDYVLRAYRPGHGHPVVSSRSIYGWED
ncbi:hypothetical protein L3Q67_45120 (plasmid) [Saccharothrix sp. AJ9571]|nr:hypothetical protein L3Q67_45120 [Saccharothrix sp. AJ9571]